MPTLTAPMPKTNGTVHPRNQTSYSVLMTSNYDLFKFMDNNRNHDPLHVKRLIESFNEQYLVCPIIVNEHYEIIDGQHRVLAAKETGKPIYYIKIHGYGIKEVQRLNTNQKNWKKIDYLHSYCAEGRKPYLEFRQFMDKFPDFEIQACERLIALNNTAQRNGMIGGKRARMNDFQEGKLVIPDIQKSYSIARKIMDFKPFYPNFKRGIFISVMMPLLTRSKVYNHKEMLHKLSNCPIKLTDCQNVEAYKMLLEDIYNYKRQKENKVSFRYE